jgi:hypothetical protein
MAKELGFGIRQLVVKLGLEVSVLALGNVLGHQRADLGRGDIVKGLLAKRF